jgi:predicted transcriptional regulator
MEAKKRLIPYSVYLPADTHARLKKAGKNRQASTLVRNAIAMILDGSDAYKTGYKAGLADAAHIVSNNTHAKMLRVENKDLGQLLRQQILALEPK